MLTCITGASAGIGLALTKLLVADGQSVVMACRNRHKARTAADEIARKLALSPADAQARILHVAYDAASLDGVRNTARELGDLPIDRLYCNAAAMFSDFALTGDAFERTLQTNYLAPVLLAESLLSHPNLRAIVHTVSLTTQLAFIDEHIFDSTPHNFSRLGTYATSKLALFLYVAARCQKGTAAPVRIAAFDPGIVNTNMITQERWFDPLADIFFRPFIRTPLKAAQFGRRALDDDRQHVLYKGKSPLPYPKNITDHRLLEWLWLETRARLNQYPPEPPGTLSRAGFGAAEPLRTGCPMLTETETVAVPN